MDTASIHSQAEQEREKGNFNEALKLYKEVIAAYQEAKNYAGVVETLQGEFLTYKHLFLKTNEISYAEKGRQSVEESLKLAQQNGLPTAFCYFHLGEASMLFKDYKKASSLYENALKDYKEGPHIGDFRYHFGESLYRTGQKEEGKAAMLTGLREVQEKAGELGLFIKSVWESGCRLRLAELLMYDNPQEAAIHLSEAKKIIEADPRLILRKSKLETLMQEMSK